MDEGNEEYDSRRKGRQMWQFSPQIPSEKVQLENYFLHLDIEHQGLRRTICCSVSMTWI